MEQTLLKRVLEQGPRVSRPNLQPVLSCALELSEHYLARGAADGAGRLPVHHFVEALAVRDLWPVSWLHSRERQFRQSRRFDTPISVLDAINFASAPAVLTQAEALLRELSHRLQPFATNNTPAPNEQRALWRSWPTGLVASSSYLQRGYRPDLAHLRFKRVGRSLRSQLALAGQAVCESFWWRTKPSNRYELPFATPEWLQTLRPRKPMPVVSDLDFALAQFAWEFASENGYRFVLIEGDNKLAALEGQPFSTLASPFLPFLELRALGVFPWDFPDSQPLSPRQRGLAPLYLPRLDEDFLTKANRDAARWYWAWSQRQ